MLGPRLSSWNRWCSSLASASFWPWLSSLPNCCGVSTGVTLWGVTRSLAGSEATILAEQADNLTDLYLAQVFKGLCIQKRKRKPHQDSGPNSDTGRASFQHPHLPCPTGDNSEQLRTPWRRDEASLYFQFKQRVGAEHWT